MKMEGQIEFNGGSLRDIQHYIIQQNILLHILQFKLLQISLLQVH